MSNKVIIPYRELGLAITGSLKCLLMGAGIYALVQVGLTFRAINQELPQWRSAIERQGDLVRVAAQDAIQSEMTKTRSLIASEMTHTRALTADELEKTRVTASQLATVLDNRMLSLQVDLVDQVDATRLDLNAQITQIGSNANAQLTEVNATISQALVPVNKITAQMADSAELFLNCENNADCLYNRWVGLGRGIENTSESVAKIANDFSVLSHNLTKPTPWYKQLISYAVVAAKAVAFF